MDWQGYSSKLLEEAVHEFAKLPGVGKKTALRFVLHLLRQEEKETEAFGSIIIKLRKELRHCKVCHNISDTDYWILVNVQPIVLHPSGFY